MLAVDSALLRDILLKLAEFGGFIQRTDEIIKIKRTRCLQICICLYPDCNSLPTGLFRKGAKTFAYRRIDCYRIEN